MYWKADFGIKTNSSLKDKLRKFAEYEYNLDAIMVIKSTIPVGYTVAICEKIGNKDIIFNPEFIRKSKTLYDMSA